MNLIELKARFGELAIEKIKHESAIQQIVKEQQTVWDKIVREEQAPTVIPLKKEEA